MAGIKFSVTNRWSGDVQFEAEIECTEDSPLSIKLGLAVKWAIKNGANLGDAYLGGANLGGANLGGAYLGGANLRDANLRGANLRGANLVGGAKGIAPERVTPLLMLLDQPGPIRAYKLVTEDGTGPIYAGVSYILGETVEAAADTDPTNHCGAGINVATLDWCLQEWKPGFRVMILEFTAADIACIPTATDGKFRLHRAKVVGEKEIDPIALGLVSAEPAEAA